MSKLTVDYDANTVHVVGPDGERQFAIGTPEAFSAISKAWLRCGWDTKYVYSFSWMGRPIVQLPDDLLRIQEVLYRVKPDVIIETGIAHGGSLVFYASLCKAMGKGRVIGIDIEIRPYNRAAIEAHELFEYITLVEGDSVAGTTVDDVRSRIKPGETVLVMLDSNHTKAHVLAEIDAYAPLVTVGSYVVAADGIMEQVVGAPRTQPDWSWNNPKAAALQASERLTDFILEEPAIPFNEGSITERVTYWPGAFLKRVR